MAPKLYKEPLVATIKEMKLHRAAPPSSHQVATVHKLPVAPEKEPAQPVAEKKKGRHYPVDYRAKLVARALQAKESGEESIEDIARAEGIHGSNIHNWIKAAQKANVAPKEAKAKAGDLRSGDLNSLARELAQAMDRVSAIKKRMRKLLGSD